jgi:hypothetical protein
MRRKLQETAGRNPSGGDFLLENTAFYANFQYSNSPPFHSGKRI